MGTSTGEGVVEHARHTGSETNDASRNSQHPKHAVDGNAVRGGGQDAAENNEQRRHDDGRLAAHVVAGQADDHLAQDLADEQGVGDAGADLGGVLVRVFLLEEHVGHGHEIVLVAIRDEGEAGAKLTTVSRVGASGHGNRQTATSIGPRLRQVKKTRAYNCEYIRQPLSFAGNPLDSSDLRLRVPLGRRIVMLPGNDINGLVVHYAQQRVAGTQVIEQQMGFKRLLSTLFLFSCPTGQARARARGISIPASSEKPNHDDASRSANGREKEERIPSTNEYGRKLKSNPA